MVPMLCWIFTANLTDVSQLELRFNIRVGMNMFYEIIPFNHHVYKDMQSVSHI
jgi:hypothetical protein